MEAVAALGVAAAAVEFVNFARESIKICKDVYDSADAATTANAHLDRRITRLDKLHADLEHTVKNDSASTPSIQNALTSCNRITHDLRQTLDDIRGRYKKPNKLKAAFRAHRRRREIDRLAKEFESCRIELQDAIAIDVRQRVDQGFDASNKQSSSLLAEMRTLHDSLVRQMTEDQSSLRLEDSFTAIRTDLQRLSLEIKAFSDRAVHSDTESRKKTLLQDLHYPAMFARHDEARQAHERTYHWLFERQSKNLDQQDCFVTFLEGSDPVYWISGKAGSGKTTLMKFISKHAELGQHLRKWAEGPVTVISHFFNANGSQAQSGLTGFLRSLIYQAVLHNESVFSLIELASPSAGSEWSSEALLDTFRRVFCSEAPTQVGHFFVLIDGLDELCGSQDEKDTLLALITQASNSPTTKICLSSRPDLHLKDALQSYPKLLDLQSLTAADMAIYTAARLLQEARFRNMLEEEPERCSTLTIALCRAAQGVFLWLYLAIDDVVTGIRSLDTLTMLHQRVAGMGGSLQDLFSSFLNRIQPSHRSRAVGLLNCRLSIESRMRTDFVRAQEVIHAALGLDPTVRSKIRQVVRSPARHEAAKASELFAALQNFADVAAVHSGGLLEVRRKSGFSCKATCLAKCACSAAGGNETMANPLACVMLHFSSIVIDFVHRSAAEFLLSDSRAIDFLKGSAESVDWNNEQWISVVSQACVLCLTGFSRWSFTTLHKSLANITDVMNLWHYFELNISCLVSYAHSAALDSGGDTVEAFFSTIEALFTKAASFGAEASLCNVAAPLQPIVTEDFNASSRHVPSLVCSVGTQNLLNAEGVQIAQKLVSSVYGFARWAENYKASETESRCQLIAWCLQCWGGAKRIQAEIWAEIVVSRMVAGASILQCLSASEETAEQKTPTVRSVAIVQLLEEIAYELPKRRKTDDDTSLSCIVDFIKMAHPWTGLDNIVEVPVYVNLSDSMRLTFVMSLSSLFMVKELWRIPQPDKNSIAAALRELEIPNIGLLSQKVPVFLQEQHGCIQRLQIMHGRGERLFNLVLLFFKAKKAGEEQRAEAILVRLLRFCSKNLNDEVNPYKTLGSMLLFQEACSDIDLDAEDPEDDNEEAFKTLKKGKPYVIVDETLRRYLDKKVPKNVVIRPIFGRPDD